MQHSEDLVVLMDADRTPVGHAPKSQIHTTSTPLHLAFSCYIVRADGLVLVTKRAKSKTTWPAVWTNSFCGHPRPGRMLQDEVRARGAFELGLPAQFDVIPVMPEFLYSATMQNGVTEFEVCPVYVGRVEMDVELSINAQEVEDHKWVDETALIDYAREVHGPASPWFRMQCLEVLARIDSEATAPPQWITRYNASLLHAGSGSEPVVSSSTLGAGSR
ncbi:isopentenyl-diphosphate Delta-isomerase [Prescottella equi]